MASAGISEAEMAAVDGDDAAMHALAEQMMARTVGDAGAGVETSMSEVESLVREVESLQKTQVEVLREDGPSSSSSSSSSSGRPSVGVEEMAAKLAEQNGGWTLWRRRWRRRGRRRRRRRRRWRRRRRR